MNLSISEIRSQKFRTKFSGFDTVEVSSFLARIADEIADARKNNDDLSKKVIELETRLKDYQSIEKALQQTLMQGQETAGKTVEIARKESQLILQEAEIKSAQILEKARTDLNSLNEQITILKAKKDSIGARLKMVLKSELDLIKALEVDEEIHSNKNENNSAEPAVMKTEMEDILKQLG
ncbi:MAG: DivIVA domain-containing protein [Ignavibacteriales bacterium]|nr:DivIVA domain-containing protein [Ignavibacteriales bacterium]